MKKSSSLFISGLLIGCIVSCLIFAGISRNQLTNNPNGNQHTRVLKFAHGLPTTHPVHLAVVYMNKRLEKISGGKMKLVIFPSAQMGDETKCIEQVQMGTLAITKISAAPMGNFVGVMKVFSLPYMFDDSAHYWSVLEGDTGKELLKRLSVLDNGKKSGFVGLGYFDSGSRNFYATYPIKTPADMVGKKFRVMRDPVAMDLVQSLGGSPTPIPWGELYTALKQGVVDGAENNPPSIVASRHEEVCKYLTLDAHSRIPDMIVVSQKVWDRLSEQEQGWLRQAMAEATTYQRGLWKKATEDALVQMKKDGVQVLNVDTTPYREAVQPVIKKYATGDIKTFYDKIRAEAK